MNHSMLCQSADGQCGSERADNLFDRAGLAVTVWAVAPKASLLSVDALLVDVGDWGVRFEFVEWLLRCWSWSQVVVVV